MNKAGILGFILGFLLGVCMIFPMTSKVIDDYERLERKVNRLERANLKLKLTKINYKVAVEGYGEGG